MNSAKGIILALIIGLVPSFAGAISKPQAFAFLNKHKLYYTAYELMKELAITNARGVDWKKAGTTLTGVHPSVFIHDKELDRFTNTPSPLDYAVGTRLFFQGRYDLAMRRLDGVGRDHPMFVERSYLKGLISLIQGSPKDAATYFGSCIRGFNSKTSSAGKPEGYIRMFRNRCIQQFSRVLYAQNRHKDSLKILRAIPKTDFIWPNTILERAWSHYYIDQRPLALGHLISFKAPILQRYMTPEAQYLKSLIYFEMCYFDKSKRIAQEFDSQTYAHRAYFTNVDKNELLKLVFMKGPPKSPKYQAIYYYFKAFKKDIRYTSFLTALKQIKRELKALKLFKKMPEKDALEKKIRRQRFRIIADYKDFLGNLVADYYQQIQRTHKHFVKMNLMLSLKEREKLRSDKPESPYSENLVEMDLDGIGNVEDKFIWNFIGGFWADELGDYAVALEDRCKEK